MTTKLGSELIPGDTIRFTHATYPIISFQERTPFLGATTGRSAWVKTGPGTETTPAMGIVTIIDRDTYEVV